MTEIVNLFIIIGWGVRTSIYHPLSYPLSSVYKSCITYIRNIHVSAFRKRVKFLWRPFPCFQVLLSDEDCLEKKEFLDSFMDTVLQEINLRDQLDKPVPILDFALEKVSFLTSKKREGWGSSVSLSWPYYKSNMMCLCVCVYKGCRWTDMVLLYNVAYSRSWEGL